MLSDFWTSNHESIRVIPHSIRLRHPWDELPGSVVGQTVYRRLFKQPTNLDRWERVFLEVDRTLVSGEFFLNGTRIGRLEYGEFFSVDITELLAPQNELRVEAISGPGETRQAPPSHSIYITDPNEPPGSLVGDVRLLIRTVQPER